MPTPSDLPLRAVPLAAWSAEPVEAALRERPLLVQIRRDGTARPPERVIVFVHGLQSGARTWLPMLSVAFGMGELQSFDFALFNYQTSVVSRLNPFQRLPTPETWAGVLASSIQNTLLGQLGYESFVLVGHSMGGLVAKFAYRSLLEHGMPAAKHLHGLFTYGTPNHGSDRASALGALLSPDLAYLRQFSEPLAALQTFWNSRISAIPQTPGKLTVHERAVVSVKDYWVAPASGIASLPKELVLQIASSHAALHTPADGGDPRIRFFVDQLRAIGKQSECSLIEVRNGPEPPDFDEEGGAELIDKLFRALLVLDAGSADGVAKGDELGLYEEATVVRDADGRIIERATGPLNTIEALEVKERVTYCRLVNLAYESALARMQKAADDLAAQGVETLDAGNINQLLFALFGRRALRIPRTESAAKKHLDDDYARVLGEKTGSPAREKALRALLIASRKLLDDYPLSIFAEDAAFHEAWSTMELGRYEEAQALFERFCEKHPLSVSVSGARGWMDEIRLRIAVKDAGSPEAMLMLAEHLLAKERNPDEAVNLALEAYGRKPALLAKMRPTTRFVLTSIRVLSAIMGVDSTQPEEMAALIEKYREDETYRGEVRAAIEAAEPPASAAALVSLIDHTSAELRRPAQDL